MKDEKKSTLIVQIEHVDGTFNAERRNERLNWLEDDTDDNICRVLTNARCLSERYTARPYQASACYRDSASLCAIKVLRPRGQTQNRFRLWLSIVSVAWR